MAHITALITKALASLLLLILLPLSANAVTLGDATLKSRLGQPLLAELLISNLNGLTVEQLRIKNAPEAIYQQFQVERSYFTQQLRFALTAENDSIKVVVSSPDPIHEPYQHFILQLLWPEGETYREYKLLIDP